MAKKRETIDTGPLLSALQRVGWFRKINDTVQVGIPDIIGNYRGAFYGIEVKAVKEVPEDGMVPPMSGHRFSPKQIHDLKGIKDSGGAGLGVIICGSVAIIVDPTEISEEGQVNWYGYTGKRKMMKQKGQWDLTNLLEWRKYVIK